MSETPSKGPQGANFSVAEAGPSSQWGKFHFPHPSGFDVEGKVFLKETLALTGMEVSLNRLKPRAFVPFLHKHTLNEELYYFIAGQGEMVVDGTAFPVKAGSSVRVAPAGERSWRNPSETDDLVYLVIQARAGTMTGSTVSDGVKVDGRPRYPKNPS